MTINMDKIPIGAVRNVYLKIRQIRLVPLSYNAELIQCVMRFSMYFITFKDYTLIAILF